MANKEPWHKRKWGGAPWWGWALIGAGAVTALVVLISAASNPPVSSHDGLVYTPSEAGVTTSEPVPSPDLPPLTLPNPGDRVTFFGDSWTQGSSADRGKGFAYVTGQALGADTVVLGRVGTGYVNPGQSDAGNYLARLGALPVDTTTKLLVLQGGLNDSGQSDGTYSATVTETIAAAKVKFPDASIVLVGPAPAKIDSLPSLRLIDVKLAAAAAQAGAHYISPIIGQWFTAENIGDVIDPETVHPSNAGHAMYAERLQASLRALG